MRLIHAERAPAELEGLADFLVAGDPLAAAETIDLIEEAVAVLKRHPLVGRPVEHEVRELAISRSQTGYVAICSLEEAYDVVLILAIRHQREAGYWS